MKKSVILFGVYAAVLMSCTTKHEEKEEAVNYSATSPLKIDTSFTKEYVAQLRSFRNIEIRAQEKGYLENIYVDEGENVKKGQLLFKIMPKLYEAELLKAKAEVAAAQIEVQNTKFLADKNVVAKNELAMVKAKLEQAKASATLAQVHLSFTEIRAPFDGTINRLPLKIGSLVDEGQLLTNLSDNNQIYAYFNVSEPEYLNYQQSNDKSKQQQVSLLLANNEPLKNKGIVEIIEGEFNNETGNIAFRAKFPNADKLLRNGETGKIEMLVPLKNALVIPQKATYEIQDKHYVFVIDHNNQLKSRNITIGAELPDLYLLSDGLKVSDKILLEGLQKVKDGDKIHYAMQNPQEVINHLKLKAE